MYHLSNAILLDFTAFQTFNCSDASANPSSCRPLVVGSKKVIVVTQFGLYRTGLLRCLLDDRATRGRPPLLFLPPTTVVLPERNEEHLSDLLLPRPESPVKLCAVVVSMETE